MTTSVRSAHLTEASLDVAGATASVICAVHCAGVALLLGFVPVFELVSQPWVDWMFLGASLLFGLLALVPGYRQHRQALPLGLFASGITILLLARLLRMPPSPLELSVVLLAASALVTAHWRNRIEMGVCRCGNDPVAKAPTAM